MVLNPLIVEQRYQEYLKQREQRQAEQAQLDAQAQTLKVAATENIEKKRLSEIHTAKKEYVCECCGKLIAKGMKYRRQSIPVAYGFVSSVKTTTQYVQRITHLVCSVEKCTFYETCGNSLSWMCTNKAGHDSYKECGSYRRQNGEIKA